jgi:hypothetical protein
MVCSGRSLSRVGVACLSGYGILGGGFGEVCPLWFTSCPGQVSSAYVRRGGLETMGPLMGCRVVQLGAREMSGFQLLLGKRKAAPSPERPCRFSFVYLVERACFTSSASILFSLAFVSAFAARSSSTSDTFARSSSTSCCNARFCSASSRTASTVSASKPS